MACFNRLTDANWHTLRSVFWLAACFGINWGDCHDSFCSLAWYFFLQNESNNYRLKKYIEHYRNKNLF